MKGPGVKRSIALVIRESDPESRGVVGCGPGDRWLVVKRPDDDEDLPGVWGLPAGTRGQGETREDLIRRIGREKLGVALDPGASVAAGSTRRPAYRLDMDLWTATIIDGEPAVQCGTDDVAPTDDAASTTHYVAWRWDDPSALEDGARRGSLCCRLGLELV